MQVGLRDLYFAEIQGEGNSEAYQTPVRLAKAIKVDLSVETAEGALFGDDSVDAIVKEFVKGTLKVKTTDLDPENTAKLLGQKYKDKVLYAGEGDKAPYVAIGFRAKKANGTYRYVWIYKAKFKVPNDAFETKGEGINFITPELEAEFIKREKDGKWKAEFTGVESDSVAQSWFTTVKEYEA